MNEPAEPHGGFVAAFDSAFARLQVRVEEACAGEARWPQGVAAGVRAALQFAAEEPTDAQVLTNEALARGPSGVARHHRLVSYVAALLEPGRRERTEHGPLPEVLEESLAGGVALLVAHRLGQQRQGELPALAEGMIEFVLTPYLGVEDARRIARG